MTRPILLFFLLIGNVSANLYTYLVEAHCPERAYDSSEGICSHPVVFVLGVGIDEKTQTYQKKVFRIELPEGKIHEVEILPVDEETKARLENEGYERSEWEPIDVDEKGVVWVLEEWRRGERLERAAANLAPKESTFIIRGLSFGGEPPVEFQLEGSGDFLCDWWPCVDLDICDNKFFIAGQFGKVLIYDRKTGEKSALNVDQPFVFDSVLFEAPFGNARVKCAEVYDEHGLGEEFMLYYYSQSGFFLYGRLFPVGKSFELYGCLTLPPEVLNYPMLMRKWEGCDHEVVQWGFTEDLPPPLALSNHPSLFYLKDREIIRYDFAEQRFSHYHLFKSTYREKETRVYPTDFLIIPSPYTIYGLNPAGLIVSGSYTREKGVKKETLYFYSIPTGEIGLDVSYGKRSLFNLSCYLTTTITYRGEEKGTIKILDVESRDCS